MSRQFTGRHMAIILISFFTVVIAVNVLMASLASSTFGGIVVDNTYVASQHFNRWLDRAEKQGVLGWTATVTRTADNMLAIQLKGAPAATTVTAEARHPLGHAPDQTLTFARQDNGTFVSQTPLPTGRWIVRIAARSGNAVWRMEENVI